MARKKKEKRKEKSAASEESGILRDLKEEALQAVVAIIFVVTGIFFVLAATGSAGVAGEKSYVALTLLLGFGYFLLPIIFFMLAVAFFRSLRRSLPILQIIGSLIFFLSGLGLIETVADTHGGLIGGLISDPLVAFFAPVATVIILFALLLISLIIIFNAALSFDALTFWRRRPIGDNAAIDPRALAAAEAAKMLSKPDSQPKIGGMDISGRPAETTPKPKEKVGEASDMKIAPISISLAQYAPPPLSLLNSDSGKPGVGDIKANANLIKRTLQNFGIIVEMDEITIGPAVTRYAFKPAEGVKLSKILGLQNNLELALAASPVRIEAPIPGKSLVGIEVPNISKAKIGLSSLLSADEFQKATRPLMMTLGRGIAGNSVYADLGKMPHLLIAGATGSGKSVTIHALITSLLYRNSPENLRLIMVDPKRVELTLYNKIPHLLTPVITDAKKAILSLKWAAKEMERRYDILQSHQVRDIDSYHRNILEPELSRLRKKGAEEVLGEDVPETMPYIVIVIDELADIMQAYPRELEAAVVRLAQMSRAVGIHLMIATQRPSVNVITGLIKANIPARIALQVVSFVDSRTILDTGGAEKLLGAGDMLHISGDMAKPVRIQSAFISESELKKVVEYLAKAYQDEIPTQIDLEAKASGSDAAWSASLDDGEGGDDALYEEALETVIAARKASTSFLQRKLGIGYARAARIVDMLEERGVVGPGEGSKPRRVLIGGSDEAAEYGTEENG